MQNLNIYDWKNTGGVDTAISIYNSSAHLIPYMNNSSGNEIILHRVSIDINKMERGKQLSVFDKEKKM